MTPFSAFDRSSRSLARLLQVTLIVGETHVAYSELHATYSKLGFGGLAHQFLLRNCCLVGMTHGVVADDLARDHGADENNAEHRSERELGTNL